MQMPSLRRVISAGAPATVSSLEWLARHLDDEAEILTPYGATESLPTTRIGSREILNETRADVEEVFRPTGWHLVCSARDRSCRQLHTARRLLVRPATREAGP